MAEHKIDRLTQMSMIVVALIVDVLQLLVGLLHFLPVVGNIVATFINIFISILAVLTFYIWFAIKGVNILGGRKTTSKAITTSISIFIEMIPVLKLLPAWSFWAWRMTTISRLKEGLPTRMATGGGLRGKLRRRKMNKRRKQNKRRQQAINGAGRETEPREEEY